MTHAGELTEEIELSRDVSVSDGAGGSTISHEVVLTAPAKIHPLRAGESVMSGRLASTQTLVITIRNQPALADAATTWTLRNTRTNKTYDVKGFTPTADRGWCDILVQTGAF